MIDKILHNQLADCKLGNKSSVKEYWYDLQENHLDDVVRLSFECVIKTINTNSTLTMALRSCGNRMLDLIDLRGKLEDKETLRLGAIIIDAMVECQMLKVEKLPVVNRKKKIQEMWVIEAIQRDLISMVYAEKLPTLKANLGYHEWTKPVMHIRDRKVGIVKKAQRHNLLHFYRYDAMPERYNNLNRLAQTEWKINKRMLEILDVEASTGNLVPQKITEDEKNSATKVLNKAKRTAIWLEDITFLQLVEEGYDEETATKYAARNADDYESKKMKEPTDVVSKWSKERDYRNCIEYAKDYGDDVLNFLYSYDSRGRAYVFNQAQLNPQGADHAKALLSFANPQQVSTWDLKITIANHAGEDKKSYEDRVKWVDDNEHHILEVGENPWSEASMEWLQATGIATEKKSKFQFIAACCAYRDLATFIQSTGSDDGWHCDIPVAYDATNSGLQILSAIGRDDYVAPFVNIGSTEKPGDVYQLIGTAVARKSPLDKLAVLEPESKAWRKIVKRNVMTKNYAATRYGMGTQQWEDKPAEQDDDTGVWHTLTFTECKTLGEVTYDTCSEYLVKASELMETMKEAVSYNDKAVVTWKLPDGFTAFQAKPVMVKEQVRVKIGSQQIQVVSWKPTDKADKRAHSSAIAPDVVHSFDAWLLSTIINRLPTTANLAFVHDAFGSDSIHGGDIQEIAKEAYYDVCSRDVMSIVLRQIAGREIELPEAGSWDTTELFNADYIVC